MAEVVLNAGPYAFKQPAKLRVMGRGSHTMLWAGIEGQSGAADLCLGTLEGNDLDKLIEQLQRQRSYRPTPKNRSERLGRTAEPVRNSLPKRKK